MKSSFPFVDITSHLSTVFVTFKKKKRRKSCLKTGGGGEGGEGAAIRNTSSSTKRCCLRVSFDQRPDTIHIIENCLLCPKAERMNTNGLPSSPPFPTRTRMMMKGSDCSIKRRRHPVLRRTKSRRRITLLKHNGIQHKSKSNESLAAIWF